MNRQTFKKGRKAIAKESHMHSFEEYEFISLYVDHEENDEYFEFINEDGIQQSLAIGEFEWVDES